jgi:calcium-dependent protein kinase
MGICQSTKNKNKSNLGNNNISNGQQPKTKPTETKTGEIKEPIKQPKEERPHKSLTKTNDIAINSAQLVSRNDGDPDQFYTKAQLLGEGSYGTVWKIKHNLVKVERAMKIIKKSKKINKETEKEIVSEIEILKSLDHPNIVKIYEFFNTDDAYYLVTEFCKGGELFKQIIDNAPFDENFTAFIMYQLLSVMYYCHKKNVIHRDLKPENILIDYKEKNGLFRIKIIDFGTAKILEKNKVEKKIIGSAYYIAPEVLMQNYNEKCDLWSCGVIMYILLSAYAPFNAPSDPEILEKIKIGHYDLSSSPWPKISSLAKDLIKKLLEKDVNKRISAEEALRHPWFANLNTRQKVNEIRPEKIKKLLNNLINSHMDKLQTAAMAYLVHNLPATEDMRDAYRLFNNIDINNDGTIQKEELYKGLKDLLGQEHTAEDLKKDVDKIFKVIDADNNGFIEYEEFVRCAIELKKILTEENLKFVFQYFDKDGSGEISVDEFKMVFGIATNANNRYLDELIARVDKDGNKEIDFEEFKVMMFDIFT